MCTIPLFRFHGSLGFPVALGKPMGASGWLKSLTIKNNSKISMDGSYPAGGDPAALFFTIKDLSRQGNLEMSASFWKDSYLKCDLFYLTWVTQFTKEMFILLLQKGPHKPLDYQFTQPTIQWSKYQCIYLSVQVIRLLPPPPHMLPKFSPGQKGTLGNLRTWKRGASFSLN